MRLTFNHFVYLAIFIALFSLLINKNSWVKSTAAQASGVTSPSPLPIGDADGDGDADEADYSIWQGHYGSTFANGASDGDFNLDNKVNGVDFAIWRMSYLGQAPSPTPTALAKGTSYTPTVKWNLADGSTNWIGYRTDMQDMQNAGINWVRIGLSSSDSFNNTHVNTLAEYSIQPLMVVWSPCTANSKPDYPATCTAKQAYRDRLTRQAGLLRGRVTYFEIHNEPNGPWAWNIDNADTSDQTRYEQAVQNYIELLRDSRDALKAGNPDAVILGGVLSEYRSERWVDAFIRYQGYLYLDVMSYHPYGNTTTRVLSRINSLKTQMNSNAVFRTKPIWVTEVGVHTDQTGGNSGMRVASEQVKADFLTQTLPALVQNGVSKPIFWYDLVENSSTYAGYGLFIKSNTSPYSVTYLPAFTAYKNLVY